MESKNEVRNYCVYKHTSPTNKSYIGITSMNPPSKRWKNGKGYAHNSHFTNAINKYGWDNFTHEIIRDGLTENEAEALERELIKKYNTFDSNNGYNATSGGEIGKQHTEKVRKKQSELAKRQWQDEEFRKRHSEFMKTRTGSKNPNYGNHKLAGKNHPNYGKKLKPETIEKMRIRASNISDETRQKMSDAAKARMTPERIEQLRIMATGRHPSEETRIKMSESQKARWNDEMRKEWGERFSGSGNGMYGKHHSNETKQKLREMFSGENSVWYGKHHTEESKKKSHDSSPLKVPVVQLNLDGSYVAEYDSYSYAAKAVGGGASSIISCCNDYSKYKSAYGYMWMTKEDYDSGKRIIYKNSKHRPTVKLDKDWNLIDKYDSVAEAARSEGAIPQNVGASCKSNGNRKSKGFRWMYNDDYNNMINKERA